MNKKETKQKSLSVITKKSPNLLEEKEKISSKATLNEMKNVFFINSNFYKVITGEEYPIKWEDSEQRGSNMCLPQGP